MVSSSKRRVMFDDLLVNKKFSSVTEKLKKKPADAGTVQHPQQHPQTQTEHGNEIEIEIEANPQRHPQRFAPRHQQQHGRPDINVLRRLFEQHVEHVERDPVITRNIQIYYGIVSGHLQDALDDVLAYAKARKHD